MLELTRLVATVRRCALLALLLALPVVLSGCPSGHCKHYDYRTRVRSACLRRSNGQCVLMGTETYNQRYCKLWVKDRSTSRPTAPVSRRPRPKPTYHVYDRMAACPFRGQTFPRPPATWVVHPWRGAGPLRFGDTVNEVMRRLGCPSRHKQISSSEYLQFSWSPPPGRTSCQLFASFRLGRLSRISTSCFAMQLASGSMLTGEPLGPGLREALQSELGRAFVSQKNNRSAWVFWSAGITIVGDERVQSVSVKSR